MSSKIQKAALWYAKLGIKVFPVVGKRPATPNGFHDATTNKEVVAAWFERAEEKQLGIAAAIPEWCVVVDIDGKAGEQAIKDYELSLPSTLTIRSGRGRHLWYSIENAGSEIKRRVKFLPSVDILVNGYVVMPPTIHPNGKQYAFDSDEDPYFIRTINTLGIKSVVETAPTWISATIKMENSRKQGVDVESFFDGIPEGERQISLFRYACHLRQRPKMLELEAKTLLRELAARCGWTEGSTNEIVERVWKSYAKKEDEDEEREVKIYTLADLAAASLPPTKNLIDGMLPSSGYTVLSSPPKKGKSLLAAYAAMCVATGQACWGRKVEQSGVLYLDLEQEESPAFDRWKTIAKGMGITYWPANLHTAFTWRPMDDGGLDAISEFMADHPHVRLVVLDTLADFWPAEEGGSSNAYHREQRIVRKFLPISRDYGFAFLLITHDTKNQQSNDMIARASGSYALNGKAKAIWSFQRPPQSDDAKLEVAGKSLPDMYEMKLRLDRENLLWKEVF